MNIPIANGVLTCETEEQAEERAAVKGADCAVVAVEMANLAEALIPEMDEDEYDDDDDDLDFDDDEDEDDE